MDRSPCRSSGGDYAKVVQDAVYVGCGEEKKGKKKIIKCTARDGRKKNVGNANYERNLHGNLLKTKMPRRFLISQRVLIRELFCELAILY